MDQSVWSETILNLRRNVQNTRYRSNLQGGGSGLNRTKKNKQNNFWIFLIWGWDTVGLCASITVITVSSETALLFVTEKYNK